MKGERNPLPRRGIARRGIARPRIARPRIVRLGIALAVLLPCRGWAAFERPPLDAGGAALGGLAVVGPVGAFGNPALPARGTAQVRFTWARPFGLRDLTESQAEWWRPGPWGVAAGARRFGLDVYQETQARVVLARAGAAASGGLGIAYREVSGTGWAPRRSVAVDVGVRLHSERGSVLAATSETVLGEVPGDPRGQGARTAVGLEQRLGSLRVHLEAHRTEIRPVSAVLGASWAPGSVGELLAGVREDPPTWSAGVRFRLPGAQIALGTSWTHPLGRTTRISVNLGAGPPAGDAVAQTGGIR